MTVLYIATFLLPNRHPLVTLFMHIYVCVCVCVRVRARARAFTIVAVYRPAD